MMQRIWATFYARCLEYVRDRSALGWNFILPVALVFGLAFVFSGEGKPLFKVGVIADNVSADAAPNAALHPFLQTQHIDFYSVPATTVEASVRKVGRHQTDMLLDLRAGQQHYWINSDSQNGYVLEKLLQSSGGTTLAKQSVQGEEIRYVDWVVPGILGMKCDVQLPVRGRLRDRALPQKWLFETLKCHTVERHRVFAGASIIALIADYYCDLDCIYRHEFIHALYGGRQLLALVAGVDGGRVYPDYLELVSRRTREQ